jgi:Cu+-exporting ATPase
VIDTEPAATAAAESPTSVPATEANNATLAAITETAKARAIRAAIPAPAKQDAAAPHADLTQIRLLVDGMNGQRCALAIENALRRTAGVTEVAVVAAARQVEVFYNISETNPEQLLKVIRELGYEAALPRDASEVPAEEARARAHFSLRRKKFAIGLLLTIPLLGISLGGLEFAFHRFVMMALATPVVFWCGSDFFAGMWASLRRFRADSNTLVALGIGTAYLSSVAVTLFPKLLEASALPLAPYFETAAVITLMILMGRMLEDGARRKTTETIRALLQAQNTTARVLREKHTVEIPVSQVSIGDIVIVRPGERVPVDGTIVSGSGVVDESVLTGESMPIDKESGDRVYAGTLNKAGGFSCRVVQTVEDTALRQIVNRLRDAQASKMPISRIEDTVSGYFLYAIVGIGIAALVLWGVLGGGAWATGAVALLSTLIIACPCALGLATPMAALVGMGKSAENGVLFKDAGALERTSRLKSMLLDKTGTITAGQPSVALLVPNEGFDEDDVLRYAASAEQHSEHPIAKALLTCSKVQGVQLMETTDFESFTGFGIRAKVRQGMLIVGNSALMRQHGVSLTGFQRRAELVQSEGKTVVFVAVNDRLIGFVGVVDPPRMDSYPVIHTLTQIGIDVVMLTGDAQLTAEDIAYRVRVRKVLAGVMPDDKVAEIVALQKQGEVVGMVGDGVNDAPAVAQADVGFTMGNGADITIEAGDVTLVNNDLKGIITALRLSRVTMKTIRLNLAFAFVFNCAAIPLAAGLLFPVFHIGLTPLVASVAMGASSILVFINSLRLHHYRLPKVDGAKIQMSYLMK